MFLIGRQRQSHCGGISRRAFLEVGASSVLGLSLLNRSAGSSTFVLPQRSVILLWLWGGPAQLDTWDPKPNAPLEFRGPFAPIATRVPGVRVGELFPRIADLADQLAILRSLQTTSNDHGVAGTIGLTGSSPGAVELDGKTAAGAARPGDRLGGRQGTRRPLGLAAVHGRRRQAAPGQEGDHRRRRRPARRPLRSVPPGVRPGRGHPDSRPATARRPDARAARRSPAAARRSSAASSGKAKRWPPPGARRLPDARRSPC